MTWLSVQAEGPTALERVLRLRPDLRDLFTGYLGLLWSERLVDPVVLELCRLRIAQLHGDGTQALLRYDAAVAAGLTEAQAAAVASWFDSPLFSEHQKACIAYAEVFAMDVHALTDEMADAVKVGMDDAAFVAFTVALGMFDGLGRFRLVLGADEPVTAPATVPAPRPDGVLH
ncbi:MAG: carboxymuconolactone decarboxylase family protein [Acidimicrobiales bacterium]